MRFVSGIFWSAPQRPKILTLVAFTVPVLLGTCGGEPSGSKPAAVAGKFMVSDLMGKPVHSPIVSRLAEATQPPVLRSRVTDTFHNSDRITDVSLLLLRNKYTFGTSGIAMTTEYQKVRGSESGAEEVVVQVFSHFHPKLISPFGLTADDDLEDVIAKVGKPYLISRLYPPSEVAWFEAREPNLEIVVRFRERRAKSITCTLLKSVHASSADERAAVWDPSSVYLTPP